MEKAVLDKTESALLDDRLLSAAMEVFLEKGFAAASVDEIASKAKASKLTFYKHYGNKEALFEAVVQRQNRALEESLIGVSPDGLAVGSFLEAVASSTYEALLRSDTVRLVRVLHAEAERFPKLGNVFNEAGPARAAKLLSAEMEKLMAGGMLYKSDPVIAAEHFLHLTLGELTRRVLLGIRPAFTKLEARKRIALGTVIFMRAYGVVETHHRLAQTDT